MGNAIYMEPVEGVENVPKSRWKLLCSLCKERVGACIQCEKPSCFTAFHVTCARSAGLLMSMKLMGTDGQLKAFCDKHLPVSCTIYHQLTTGGLAASIRSGRHGRRLVA